MAALQIVADDLSGEANRALIALHVAAAQTLYAKHGFAACPPFGEYSDDDFSLCMSRTL